MNRKFLFIFLNLLFVNLIFSAELRHTYDYIVIGSGSAGAVIAARLAEDPKVRVLLVERGQDVSNDPTTIVPTVNNVLPPVDLSLFPTEQIPTYEKLLSSGYTRSFVAFGLGGASTVSGLFWGRPDPTLCDEWAELVGDDSLRYESLLTYFKRTENVLVNQSSSADRGRNGPIEIVILDPNDPSVTPWKQSQSLIFNLSIGIDYCTSAGQEGIWPMQRNLKRSPDCTPTLGPCQRMSSYEAYIRNYPKPNLEVITNAEALKLIFGPGELSDTVIGVLILYQNEVKQIRANKEVILSSGTVNSAKQLLLSGVGDSNELNQLNIPIIKHLPGVGQNIQDHAVMQFGYYLPTADTVDVPSAVTITFMRTGFHNNYIDLEIAWGLLPTSLLGFPPGTPGALLIGYIVQVRGANVGNLSLKSVNPFERVDMELNLNVSNLNPIIFGFRKVRTWLQASGVELIPGVQEVPVGATDAQIQAYLSKVITGWFHMTGSCKMGRLDDPMAVVDSEFKVIGIRRLRVVDCSVLPIVPSTHPTATATMLGERAAALIKAAN